MLYKMKLTSINIHDTTLPEAIREKFSGVPFYDSSCSPEARVYFADKDEGYFIKVAKCGTLEREAVMTDYFASLGLSKPTLLYESGERDLLITRKIEGEDLTSATYLAEPKRLATKMGEILRELHERSHDGCPVANRTADYLIAAEEGYSTRRFDPSYIDGRLGLTDMESTMRYIRERQGMLTADTLLHGDFCLPNVIFKDFELSGYIDLGGAGVGDRHIDIFWGAWTLNYNLGTDSYRDTFLDAYGRDKVDEEKLLLVSAIESFG